MRNKLGLIIVLLGSVIFMMYLMWTGYAEWQQYDDMTKDFVQVEATITNIDIISHHHGRTDTRDVYISYKYNGKVYSNVKYDKDSSDWRVGRTIIITIDPKSPSRIMVNDYKDYAEAGCYFFIILFCILHRVIFSAIAEDRIPGYKRPYLLLREKSTHEKIVYEFKKGSIYSLLIGIFMSLALIIYGYIHYYIYGYTRMTNAIIILLIIFYLYILLDILFKILFMKSRINYSKS